MYSMAFQMSITITEKELISLLNKEKNKSNLIQTLLIEYYKKKQEAYEKLPDLTNKIQEIEDKKQALTIQEQELVKIENERKKVLERIEEQKKQVEDRERENKIRAIDTTSRYIEDLFICNKDNSKNLAQTYVNNKEVMYLYDWCILNGLIPKEQGGIN